MPFQEIYMSAKDKILKEYGLDGAYFYVAVRLQDKRVSEDVAAFGTGEFKRLVSDKENVDYSAYYAAEKMNLIRVLKMNLTYDQICQISDEYARIRLTGKSAVDTPKSIIDNWGSSGPLKGWKNTFKTVLIRVLNLVDGAGESLQEVAVKTGSTLEKIGAAGENLQEVVVKTGSTLEKIGDVADNFGGVPSDIKRLTNAAVGVSESASDTAKKVGNLAGTVDDIINPKNQSTCVKIVGIFAAVIPLIGAILKFFK